MDALFFATSLLRFFKVRVEYENRVLSNGEASLSDFDFGFRFGNEFHTLDLETNKLWDFAFGIWLLDLGTKFRALIWKHG